MFHLFFFFGFLVFRREEVEYLGSASALEPLINASVQTADGFLHEYSKAALAYHFLCSVLTLSVGEAASAASEPRGLLLLIYLLRCEQQTCNLHFFLNKVRLNTTLFSNVTLIDNFNSLFLKSNQSLSI